LRTTHALRVSITGSESQTWWVFVAGSRRAERSTVPHQLAEAEADSRRTIRASPGSKKQDTGVTTGQRLAQLTLPTLNNKIANNTTSEEEEHRTTKARKQGSCQKRRFSCLSD
jgi:hypothetical protein